ncbi:MAG: PAS domain-containing protein [Desulfobacterales bacterium]|nr:PAS domain-containing protein [Desulfobacterales bacterium]
MKNNHKTTRELQAENAELRDRLAEAEEVLQAIGSGAVDAVVVSGPEGEQVFTLRGAEHAYRVLVEAMNEGAATLSLDGAILYANASLAKMLKKPLEKIIGTSLRRYVAPEDLPLFDALLLQGAQTSSRGEITLKTNDAARLPAFMSISKLELEEAQALCIVATDLTEQKRNEEMVAAERLSRCIIEQAGEAIVVCDAAGRIIRASGAAHRLAGVNPIFQPFEEPYPLIREDNGQPFTLAPMLEDESFTGLEAALPRQDGRVSHLLLSAAPLKDGRGRIIGAVVTLTDITRRKRAEEGLIDAAAKWRTTFDSIVDAVSLMDREHTILQCNQAMADLVGKPFSEIVGRPCWEVVHGTTGPIEGCPSLRMLASRRRETLTLQMGDRWLHVIVDPVLSEAGEVTGGVHLFADITQRKRDEDKIRNLNTLLKAIKDINEVLLSVKSEPELFRQLCDSSIQIPYVRFAWIGLVEPESFAVKPVAWAGVEEGYLSATKVTYDDFPFGRGPTGAAVKTGQPVVVDDIETDPAFVPWREEARQRGYASFIALPMTHDGASLGTFNVYAGKKYAFGEEEIAYLQRVAGDIAVGVKSLRMEQELAQSLIKLQIMMIQTIEAISSMAELRDPYTAGHQQVVTRLALALAQEMGLAPDRTEGLRVASLIHDIGKIVVPAEILSRPGKISDIEMEIIRTHSQAGYEILKKIDFPWPVGQIVLQHHERLNGSGYPQGLKGSDILQEAKVLAVADVVEAMSSHRPYRPALGVEKALEEITLHKGVLYDAEVVDACMKLFTEKGFHLEN